MGKDYAMDGSTNSAAASILARAFIISFLFPELTASRSHENGFVTCWPTQRTELIGWRAGYEAADPTSTVSRNVFAAIADNNRDDCSFRSDASRAFICLRSEAMSARSFEISSVCPDFLALRVFFFVVFSLGIMPSFSNLSRAMTIARETAFLSLKPASLTAISRSVVVPPCCFDTFTFLSQRGGHTAKVHPTLLFSKYDGVPEGTPASPVSFSLRKDL